MITMPQMVYEEMRSRYKSAPHTRITAPEDILQIKRIVDLSTKNQEHFITITLDSAAQVIKTRVITKGLLNRSLVHPREVYRDAIRDNAHSIICVHNHPSGSLEPSSQDISITKQLHSAGEIIGISVLDHVIVSRDGITSMRQQGYL